EPSARQLAEIEEFVKTYKVKTIFVENAISTKAAKTIAHSTGASIQVLSPLEADPQNNLSLLENIEQNLKVLSQHL
ncbi:zinc ABC transporter substrate-binding protein, partial [Streptococcus suis]